MLFFASPVVWWGGGGKHKLSQTSGGVKTIVSSLGFCCSYLSLLRNCLSSLILLMFPVVQSVWVGSLRNLFDFFPIEEYIYKCSQKPSVFLLRYLICLISLIALVLCCKICVSYSLILFIANKKFFNFFFCLLMFTVEEYIEFLSNCAVLYWRISSSSVLAAVLCGNKSKLSSICFCF